jgi:hypothetical protein
MVKSVMFLIHATFRVILRFGPVKVGILFFLAKSPSPAATGAKKVITIFIYVITKMIFVITWMI